MRFVKRTLDKRGRITLTLSMRKKVAGRRGEVLLVEHVDHVEFIPPAKDVTSFFDQCVVDIDPELLLDYRALKSELLGTRHGVRRTRRLHSAKAQRREELRGTPRAKAK